MKKLLSILLIINLTLLIATAQTKQEQKLISLYEKGEYLKCLKATEKLKDEYNTGIASLYKLISLNKLNKSEYVKTNFPEITPELLSLLSEIKKETIDTAFINSFNAEAESVQKTIFKQIDYFYNNTRRRTADSYINKLLQVFDAEQGFFQLMVSVELAKLFYEKGEDNISKQRIDIGMQYFKKLVAFAQKSTLKIPVSVQIYMQQALFNAGKEYYEKGDFINADICFNHIYSVFYNKDLNYLYGIPEEYKDKLFSFSEYNNPKYHLADVGKNNNSLTLDEKALYFYINLFRMNPQLFLNTYMKKHIETRDSILAQKTIIWCSFNFPKIMISEAISRLEKIERLSILTVQYENKNRWSCRSGFGGGFSLNENNIFMVLSMLLGFNTRNLLSNPDDMFSCTGKSYFTLELVRDYEKKSIIMVMGRYK